jgi:hypothetical protein
LIVVALSLTALAGCTTTQQKAARLQLNNARIRTNLRPLEFSGGTSTAAVTSVRLLAGHSKPPTAVVVTVRNRGGKPISDLPLLVGVSLRHGHRMYLNAAAGVSYFRNHLPAIPSHGQLSWVLTVDRRVPAGAEPFARLGPANPATATTIGALPLLRVSSLKSSGGSATLTVQNSSGVTQYQLPVYAVAQRGARWVAAGQTTIEELDGRASTQLRLPLVGNPSGATLSLEAPPTIFK